MRLVRFVKGEGATSFGLVVGEHAVALRVLQQRSGITHPGLGDSRAYLEGLPETEGVARKLLAWAEAHLGELPEGEKPKLDSLDAAKKIDFGPYGDWRAPARLYMNVERAYREFRRAPPDAPWSTPATFDAIYKVAKAKGIRVEY